MHTVEKIGGSSMTDFATIMNNVIIAGRSGKDLYNRIFVVSAYGGVTDMLLEGKKNSKPGIYALYAANDAGWVDALENTRDHLCALNKSFVKIGLDQDSADEFIVERFNEIKSCLYDLQRLSSYGHFQIEKQLLAVRELLSAVGEAHSARNSAEILCAQDVNAQCIDLTGWKDLEILPFNEKILSAFEGIDLSTVLPIATGYTKCSEGIMSSFDRGYSEITFSKIAELTGASEGVIHKEFHLSSSDPKVVGVDKVEVIGQTNYDVADQLADLGMEAIHPKASKGMENKQIPIRIKNAFDPDHAGTLISHDFVSEKPRVEMVTGCKNMLAIELWDSDMVGQSGYDFRVLQHLKNHGISYVAKNTNANTITHYVRNTESNIDACMADIIDDFSGATVRTQNVAIVSAIGSNMKFPGFLAKAAGALAEKNINILAVDQCMRQVNMQFIVSEDDFEDAIRALHRGVVEQ
ncbi:MAG: aspartate kinase [Lentisphaeria bacterium]|nr:aspartate kinase [Lentisphaeria bacterium]